jgi:hypothetical protein
MTFLAEVPTNLLSSKRQFGPHIQYLLYNLDLIHTVS